MRVMQTAILKQDTEKRNRGKRRKNDKQTQQLLTYFTNPFQGAFTWFHEMVFPQVFLQGLWVFQSTEVHKGLRDPVVGKHRNGINVLELAVTLTLETRPYVGNEDLCTLVDGNSFVHKLSLISAVVKHAILVGGEVI